MKKIVVLVLAGFSAAVVATAVIAQPDPIAARKALMKANSDGARDLVAMMRGQVPFDAGKVDAVFGQWAETAQKLPGLFPDDSKSGGKTRAAPKIWQDKADFDAKATAFGTAVADNRDKAKGSLEALKAAIPVVGKGCDNCHEDYRLPAR
ncbi:MAG: c-type cytochrome [Pseudolabrys sp.]